MKTIKIEATIDANDLQQVEAAVAFLKSLNGQKVITGETLNLDVGSVKEKPVKEKAEKPAKEKPAKAKAKEEVIDDDTDDRGVSVEISIDDVRKVLSTKVKDNRTEIKAKLTELGAPNVTKLDPEKYQEFVDFLNDLDNE